MSIRQALVAFAVFFAVFFCACFPAFLAVDVIAPEEYRRAANFGAILFGSVVVGLYSRYRKQHGHQW